MGFIKWMDKRNRIVKIIFCLPILDIIWAIYRIVGCFAGKFKPIRLVLAIIWLIVGGFVLWILDLIWVIIFNHICWFKD